MTASMTANTSGYIADRYTNTQAHAHRPQEPRLWPVYLRELAFVDSCLEEPRL